MAGCAFAQQSTLSATDLLSKYLIMPDITYNVANNYENKLDVAFPRKTDGPVPAVIYIHGGGWIGGSKGIAMLQTLPYLEMGWAAVSVEYRMARVSPAPAAVEDCRCALRWVVRNAKRYNIDPERLVVTGESAGGHLSLMTGMLTEAAGLDNNCPSQGPNQGPAAGPEPHVAAIVDWYGITDVADLLDGPNRKAYAVQWLGSAPNREEIARRVSPLTYVRKDLPPIMSIQGDADPIVPYSHSVRLKEALDKAGVPNELFTVPGGSHGGFTKAQYQQAFDAVRAFLAKHNLGPVNIGQ